jgi:hypothetical protein
MIAHFINTNASYTVGYQPQIKTSSRQVSLKICQMQEQLSGNNREKTPTPYICSKKYCWEPSSLDIKCGP